MAEDETNSTSVSGDGVGKIGDLHPRVGRVEMQDDSSDMSRRCHPKLEERILKILIERKNGIQFNGNAVRESAPRRLY